MEQYELVVVTDEAMSESDRKKQLDQINKLIGAEKGKIAGESSWGKKEFAYPIDKSTYGYYNLIDFEGSPLVPQSLTSKLNLMEDLLRFIIVKKEGEGKAKKGKGKSK